MKTLLYTAGLFLVLTAGVSAEINPLKPGESVPPLTLQTADGAAFNLNEALAEKPAVLIFYRGGWCPYCSLHLAALQKIEPQLVKAGWQILAISPDRPEKVAEAKQEEAYHYRLLSDSKMEAAKAFGKNGRELNSDVQNPYTSQVQLIKPFSSIFMNR